MVQDDSVIREVEQELAADRQQAFLRKYGAAAIAGAVAIVGGVAGWQVWTGQQSSRAAAAAVEFNAALEALDASPQDGRQALADFAGRAPAGYAVLAELRRAGSLAASGDRDGALAVYRAVYADSRAPAVVRDLARLRAGYLSIVEGRQAVSADLGALIEQGTVFGAYAREIAGLAALEAGAYADARAMFARAADDMAAPEPVRQRAEDFAALAAAGAAGVNVQGRARVDDLLRALDTVSDHAGHDHHDHAHDGDADGHSAHEDQADAGPGAPAADDGSEPEDE